MAKSLVKLTLESNDYERKLRQAQKSMDDFTKKIGINTKSLTTASLAAGAVSTAFKVLGDAMKANEAMVDKWGATMRGATAAYDGFLNALNNGDISGYLSRIDSIVDAARKAYAEIDRLGTMKTIQGPQISKQQAENDRMRAMLQTGRYIAPAAGSGLTATMATGTLLTDEQKRRVTQQLENGTKGVITLMENEVKQAGNAIDAMFEQYAKELGMSKSEFLRGTSSMAAFDEMLGGAANYRKWRKDHTRTTTGMYSQVSVTDPGNPYEKFRGWDTFRVDGEKYNRLVDEIKKRDAMMSQIYGMYGQSYKTINRTLGISAKISGSGKAEQLVGMNLAAIPDVGVDFMKGVGIRGSINMGEMTPLRAMTERLANLQSLQTTVGGHSPEMYARIAEMIKKQQKEIEDFTGDNKGKGSIQDIAGGIGQMTGGISSVVSGIEQLGIDIPDGLQDVVNTLGGISTIVGGIASTVTAIGVLSALPWANGGIVHAAGGSYVPGHSYSGDLVPAMLNSGELVLNRAQQGNLAAQLTEKPQGQPSQPYVSGEMIFLGMSNYMKRTGRGEFVLAKGTHHG